MKNNGKKRILSGAVAAILTAVLIGTCGYQGQTAQVYAKEETHTKTGGKAAGEADTEELKETAEKVLGDTDSGEGEGFYKDESVYVKADASGKVKETTVTEWLKNPGSGDVADSSELKDIQNVKGDEEFTRGNDGELTWKSDGEDIYYQGTTDKPLPVDVKISYKLDGKNIAAKDLEGKDGKAEIHIEYTNNSKEMVSVNNENVEMYTPFTMVTALMLPADEYKNVTIDNGKIISDADKNIAVGVALPGLKDNLKLQDLDVDIPESVTVKADVEDASVGPTMTVASADAVDMLELDKASDFDSFAHSINELDDAAKQLVDGSGELAEGAGTLNSRTAELTGGVNELADGVNAYTGGVSELAAGSTQLLSGADALRQGAAQAQGGVASAKAGADALAAAYAGDGTTPGAVALAQMVNNGVSAIISSMGDGGGTGISLAPQDAADEACMAASMAEMAAEPLTDEALSAMGMTREQYIASLKTGYETLLQNQTAAISQSAADAQSQMEAQQRAAAAQAAQLAAAAAGLQQMVEGLSAGTTQLQAGLEELNNGSGALVRGTNDLYNGTYALQQGAAKLNSSSSLLTAGTQKLQAGSRQFADGAGQLASGSNTLAAGMAEFKSVGVDKLTEVFNGDIQNVTGRIDAMQTLGKQYTSFAGTKDGAAGSTRFIIETEGI